MNAPYRPALLLAVVMPVLSSCDMLGIESTAAIAARREAEGKAVGAACRHAGRPLEDCYALNRKADKAAIFTGWREMSDYMRENKIAEQPSQGANPAAAVAAKEADEPALKTGKR